MGRDLWLILVLTSFALSGCLGGDDDTTDDGGGSGDDGSMDDGTMQSGSQEVSGSLTFQGESCLASRAYVATGTVPVDTPLDGITRIVFDVDPDTIGAGYQAAWTFDQGYIEVATIFTDSAGGVISVRVEDAPNFGSLTVSGTVPEGAEIGILYACAGPITADVVYQAGA